MAMIYEAKRSKCQMWWRGVMAQGMKCMNMCMVWAAIRKDVSIVQDSLHTIQYQRFCGMSFELFHVPFVQTVTSKPTRTQGLQLQELQQPSCVIPKECETPGVTFCPTNSPREAAFQASDGNYLIQSCLWVAYLVSTTFPVMLLRQ